MGESTDYDSLAAVAGNNALLSKIGALVVREASLEGQLAAERKKYADTFLALEKAIAELHELNKED